MAGAGRRREESVDEPRSALKQAEAIWQRLDAQRPALFLDYDGTLTPIVERPEDATLSGDMRSILEDVSRLCLVAIVSGRDRADVEAMVNLPDLVYAGSHGFDIRGPQGLELEQPEARQALPDLERAEEELRQRLDGIRGARLERKRFAIAVHYRQLERPEDAERVERQVDEVVDALPTLRKKGGKKIFELQPDVDWDKGRAVLWLAEKLGLADDEVLLMYVGDNVTDEDAFRALRRGRGGIGIRVAAPDEPTDADYYLRDCGEVREFLQRLHSRLAANERKADR